MNNCLQEKNVHLLPFTLNAIPPYSFIWWIWNVDQGKIQNVDYNHLNASYSSFQCEMIYVKNEIKYL